MERALYSILKRVSKQLSFKIQIIMFYVHFCHSQNNSKDLWLSELPEMTKNFATLCFLPYISLFFYSQTAFINRQNFCNCKCINC
jgi:hypothetical protein